MSGEILHVKNNRNPDHPSPPPPPPPPPPPSMMVCMYVKYVCVCTVKLAKAVARGSNCGKRRSRRPIGDLKSHPMLHENWA